jgi:hypothetical protein
MTPILHSARSRTPLVVVLLAAAGFAACGGGNDEPVAVAPAPAPVPAPAPAPAPVATTTPVTVKVIDGALRNALVCVDLDDDGACGASEPQARTDAAGNATLAVPNAEVGRHAVVAVVGTDAVDADFGPVTAPFVLTAPGDRPAVVSPLTTLVEARSRSTGEDSAAAESALRGQAGLQVSLFTDYTASPATDAPASSAGTVARLVVLAAQEQAAALAPAIGTADLSGATITRADVDRATRAALLQVLPVLGAAGTDPAVVGATDRDAALRTIAQGVVASDTGLDAAGAAAAIGLQRLYARAPAAGAAETGGTVSLRTLRYTDASNWFYRAIVQSPQDLVPDAQGRSRFQDVRRAPVAGTVQTWSLGNSFARRGDLFWNGSAWVDCPAGTRSTRDPADASGRSAYVYCGGFSTGITQATETPIAGRTLASVVEQIRRLPGSGSGVPYASWGPADTGLLGTAVFPEGAKIGFTRSIETGYAPSYDPTSAPLAVIDAAVAAGGNATVPGASDDPPCRAITPTVPFASYASAATALEQVIARNRGTPCRYAPGTDPGGNASGPRNEWWGNSTVSIGTVEPATDPRPAGTGEYYRRTRDLRFAFTGDGQVTYYGCLVRASGATGRNCDVIGSGAYRIETLGDARVLSLGTPPTATASLSYERVLIERGGSIWYGFRPKPTTFDTPWLNRVAADTLLGRLGLPLVTP